jgi:hypothetical protein
MCRYTDHDLTASLISVINDFNVGRAVASPNEADAILLVDSDAVLPLSISRKRFKSVSNRDPEVFQLLSRVQEF